MGHRNTFNQPQILDTESSQRRNHTDQPYRLMGRTVASESSSLVHYGENININGGPFPSPWTTAPRSRINSSSIPNAEGPRFQQQQAPCPSRVPFLHQPAGGNFHMAPDSYSHLPSSSSLGRQTVPEAHGNFVNQTIMGSGRGPYKRKRPSIPQLYDRGSTSRYYDIGSSSNSLLPADPWQQYQNTGSYHMPWEYGPGNRINSLSIGEGMQRNVRSRTVVNQDPNLAITHCPNNWLHRAFSHSERSNLVDFSGQTSNTSARHWNHCLISPAGHGGTHGADARSFVPGPYTLNAPNSYASHSVESGCYSNNAYIPPNNYGYLNRSHREVQSNYQRPAPAFGVSSGFYPCQVAASGEGPVMTAGNFPYRHPQAFSAVGFRYNEENVRRRIPNERYRPSAEESSVFDQVAPEEIAANNSVYDSRTRFDQHSYMRLDVDNMSYEELLALGERIGSVSTGLSDDLVSKCLTRSMHCSSDQSKDNGACVICLEEYKDKDDVGTLKCGHDFHVGCIGKWLSVKNLCPICKGSAIDDSMKEELST